MERKYFAWVRHFYATHKKTAVVVTLCLLWVAYYGYAKFTDTSGETRYVTAAVEKGTIVVSVTGSGQVAAISQVEAKPKASGDVVYVAVKNGESVYAGQLLAQLDDAQAQKTVRDAEASLLSAKLSLEKIKKPADALTLLQAENNLQKAIESRDSAIIDLAKDYDDGFSNVSNAFLNLPTTINGLQNILYTTDSSLGTAQWNIDYYTSIAAKYDEKANSLKDDATSKFTLAKTAYDKNFLDYKSADRISGTSTIYALISETYDTTRAISEAVKSANNVLQFYKDKLTERNIRPAAVVDTHLTSLNTYTGTTNSYLLSLLSSLDNLRTSQNTISSSERSIVENTAQLDKTKSGADALDIQSSELSVKQRENALLDAKETLANYYVRSPITGSIAKLTVAKGDSVSGGTAVATIVSPMQVASISLNEVDAAKVKVGQRATMSFDAIEGLTITGKVIDMDTVGTVSQGVVTYVVKIGFDIQDARVKPGMTVSAAIVTEAKTDVLLVPNSAVKSDSEGSYVEKLSSSVAGSDSPQGVATTQTLKTVPIETGLSNDTDTEILTGVKEGEQIIVRTILPTTSVQTGSLLGGGTSRNTGGQAMRALR